MSNLLHTTTLAENQSPYEKLHGVPPEYSALRTFGCSCYPTLRDYAANKFDPRSLKCVFMGYNIKYKGYRCLYPPTGRVYISRHVLFDELTYPFADTYLHLQDTGSTKLTKAWQQSFSPQSISPPVTTQLNGSIQPQQQPLFTDAVFPPLQPQRQNTTTPHAASSLVQPVLPDQPSTSTDESLLAERECIERTTGIDPASIGDNTLNLQDRSDSSVSNTSNPETTTESNPTTTTATESNPTTVQNSHPMITRAKQGIRKPNPRYALLTQKAAYPEPRTVTEALKDDGWKEAMGEEIDTCMETNTFTLVSYKPDMNVIGSKWVSEQNLMQMALSTN